MKLLHGISAAVISCLLLTSISVAEPDQLSAKRRILKPAGNCINPFCHSKHQNPEKSCEPLAPDVLDVSIVGNEEETETGELEIKLVVKPSSFATVELVTPNSPRLQGVAAARGVRLEKGALQANEYQLSYAKEKNRRENLSFTVNLRNENGDLLANVTKVIKINEEVVEEGSPDERVPVVIEAGGRRLVEYMTRSAAAARGLTPTEPQAAPAAAPANEEDTQEEEDAR